jgi:hypothetical protein
MVSLDVTPRRLVEGTEIFKKYAATLFSVENADSRYPRTKLQGVSYRWTVVLIHVAYIST